MTTRAVEPYHDPIVEEVRRIKAEIAAEHGHDIHRLATWLREEQKNSGLKLVSPPQRKR